MYVFTLSLQKINLVNVKQHKKKIVKYEQKQIVQSKFICEFIVISICFNIILRLFLFLLPHIRMETTLGWHNSEELSKDS